MTPAPPSQFTPARHIEHAEFTFPPHLKYRRYTGRRLQGIKYERAVHEYLAFRFEWRYVASPWIKFWDGHKWRWCQPDGLIFDPTQGRITIVEVKYQHTADAWWQIRHLYQPVLEHMLPSRLWKYDVCEIVKWFDPAIVFPEKIVLANEPDMRHSDFKVHIWKP